jgi:superfamily II DNA or RNA helicase
VVACTGSGKTRFGIEAARAAYIAAAGAACIVVVCPTRAIRKGWGRALAAAELRTVTSIDDVDQTVEAMVMTYAALSSHGGAVRRWLASKGRKAIAVLDEVHHVGEVNGGDRGWGAALTETFTGCYQNIIALTATPYRTAGRIALLDSYYKEERPGRFVITAPDFRHRYLDELQAEDDDGAGVYRNVTDVVFTLRHAEADITRRDAETGRKIESYTVDTRDAHALSDDGESCGHAACKRASSLSCYVPNGLGNEMHEASRAVVRSMLAEAAANLASMRGEQGMWWAGGLVVCANKRAAENVRRWIDEAHGPAAIVHSDDPHSMRHLEDFKRGSLPWLVSVDMVSEGVDISRLKVLVSIGTKQTRLRIIQEIGRVIRRHRDGQGRPYPGPQTAHVYALNVPAWRYVATKFEDDVRAASAMAIEPGTGDAPERSQTHIDIDATRDAGVEVVANGDVYDGTIGGLAEELRAADYDGMAKEPYGYALKLASHMINSNTVPDLSPPAAAAPVEPPPPTLSEQKAEVKRRRAVALGRLAAEPEYREMSRRDVYKMLNKAINKAAKIHPGINHPDTTLAKLEDSIVEIEVMHHRLREARRRGDS